MNIEERYAKVANTKLIKGHCITYIMYEHNEKKKHNIQGVPKLFVQINTGGREYQNKYISLWYIMVPDGNF